MSRISVVGAGVVGLACAARLRLRGHQVTLIDPLSPGEHCSSGNAGCFSRASFVPLGLPGMWKKVPRWLLDRKGPLSVPARNALKVAPWLWRLHRSTSIDRVNAIADALHPLLTPTIEKWRPIAAWAGVPELIRQEGYAFLYESEESFSGDSLGRELRRARGVQIEILTGNEIREFDPILSSRITHLVLLPEQGHCPNPLRLSQAIAQQLQREGTPLVRHLATGFRLVDGRVSEVETSGGPIPSDAIVIAAGARSNSLSSQLGCPVLLETERGYHVMLESPNILPRIPVMSGEGKYFITPMEGGLRIAGTVELAGLDAPPNYRRSERLLEGANGVIPGMTYKALTRWMGHRPSMPDSKPVIGRAPGVPNAFFAFGHGHVGLTAAAPTAEIIADLIAGQQPYMDIVPFAPDRDAVRRGRIKAQMEGESARR